MSNVRRKFVLISTIFALLSTSFKVSFAEYSTNFESITNKDGLSQSTIQIVYQDSDGYVWMGSNDGLNRYDGNKIKVYKSSEGNNTISDNYILNITEDYKKNLWISTVNGLTKINIDTWEIRNYYSDEEEGNLSNDFVNTVLAAKDGSVLVGTADGINLYNEDKDCFEQILEGDKYLTNQNIKSIVEDVNGDIWIGTKSGINKIDPRKKSISKYYENQEVDTLLADQNNNIWISTPGDGVIRMDIEAKDTKHYRHVENEPNSLPSNYVKKMHEDKKENIWFATESGLAKYTYKDDNFYIYKNKSYDPNSLINDSTFSVIEDRTGLIWVGTYAGVSMFDPDNKIQHYSHNPYDKNSLSSNVIHGIYEDEDGLIWVGTQNNGVNIIDREKNSIKHIEEGIGKYSLNCGKVKVITGKDNKVWIGTKEGINEINTEDMSVKVYTSDNNIAGNNIKTLYLDSKGYLWIGTPDGLSLLNTNDDSIRNITYVLSQAGVKDTYVEDIYEDVHGNYWIGTFLGGGLININPDTKEVTVFTTEDLPMNNGSKSKAIRSITGDNNNNIWIGTSSGLVKYDTSTKVFKSYTNNEGLSNNTVYGVLVDIYGRIWSSTNEGISILDLDTDTFTNLNINDGLQANEFNGKAYYKSKRGELFFGGINGLNILSPDEIVKEQHIPNIVFDSFEVEGKDYSDIDNLVFEHDKNTIRFRYFIPNYRYDNHITFEYRLSGQNDEWITLDSNEVVFSELDPGKYTFEIRYNNKSDSKSDISSIKFTIDPPFWQSNFAIMIYAMLSIIVAYIIRNRVRTLDTLVSIRTKQLSKEMEKSNKLLNQVINLERNKNNYFVNLSHELRTPLNVINSIEQLVTEFNKSEDGLDKLKLDHYMCIMRKNTKRLLNLINNIIDTNKIEHGSYKVNIKPNDIVYIVEETALSMKEYIESKGINLVIDTDIEEQIILCDSDEIERCIVNLVSNAAKFTPSGGTIEVSISNLVKKVKISVSDTGIGIDEKFHKFIFDRFNQVVDSSTETKGGSGLGLTITKHIIDLHGGKIYVQSEKNKGSKFTIILPINE